MYHVELQELGPVCVRGFFQILNRCPSMDLGMLMTRNDDNPGCMCGPKDVE